MPTAGTAGLALEKTMKPCFSGRSLNSDKSKAPSKQKRSSGVFIHSLILISKTEVCIVSLIVLFVFPCKEEPLLCIAF